MSRVAHAKCVIKIDRHVHYVTETAGKLRDKIVTHVLPADSVMSQHWLKLGSQQKIYVPSITKTSLYTTKYDLFCSPICDSIQISTTRWPTSGC